MIKIENVVVPTKGTGKYLNVRVLTFDLTPTSGISLYWSINAEQTNEEGEVSPGAMLLEGNLHMPQETYDQWGTDDSYVTDWAAKELGVTIITE